MVQIDSSTHQVTEVENHREVCICGEFEGGSNPQRRVQLIGTGVIEESYFEALA